MTKISIVFAAVMALGCGNKSGETKATGSDTASAGGGAADCDKAIAHSMEVGKASLPADDAKMMAKLHDMGVKHCVDDKWPEPVVKCMLDAKTEADGQACYGKLTPDQQKKMNDDAMSMATPK